MSKSIETEILINYQPPSGESAAGTIPAHSFLSITSRLVEGVSSDSDPTEVAGRWAEEMDFMGRELPVSILAVARMVVNEVTSDVVNSLVVTADQDVMYDHYQGRYGDGDPILSINVLKGELPVAEDRDVMFSAHVQVERLMQTALFAALNFAELDSAQIDVGIIRADLLRTLMVTLNDTANSYYQVSMMLGFPDFG